MNIAMAFSSYGPPEVLRPVEVLPPAVDAGQVRVRVKAAGVQPFDCSVRRGYLSQRFCLLAPRTPGNEFSGLVEAVGHGVSNFEVGDEVLGYTFLGAYASLVVADVNQIVRKPSGMPWEEAAVLSASGQTAATAMKELRVGKGDTVLIHAAAGGVGTVAVQLAHLRGAAKVIGTASLGNHEYLRSLGAIPVSYGEGMVDRIRAIAPEGLDAVLDAIGGSALDASVALAKSRERIVTIADPASRFGVRFIRSTRSQAQLQQLVDLYAAGKLKLSIWKSFPLADAARAHREVEAGHVRGKVVLVA